jgi:hypothetical protein
MSVGDYAIDGLFDVGPKSNTASALGGCYSANTDFSNWTKVQPFGGGTSPSLKPSPTQTIQNKGGATFARYQVHVEQVCKMKHRNDARPASGLNLRGDLTCAPSSASR